jgi:hypothetical protein
MTPEIAQLKADLTDLNMKCQLARDNEVRFALQRGRLEAERTNLLVKMIEALAPTADTLAVAPATAPAASCADPYTVTMSCPRGKAPAAPFAPYYPTPVPDVPVAASPSRAAGKQKLRTKPANLPTAEAMILAVLQSGDWMRPNQITQAIRDRYWKGMSRTAAPSVVWRMWQANRLEKGERGYRLPVASTSNGYAVGAS